MRRTRMTPPHALSSVCWNDLCNLVGMRIVNGLKWKHRSCPLLEKLRNIAYGTATWVTLWLSALLNWSGRLLRKVVIVRTLTRVGIMTVRLAP